MLRNHPGVEREEILSCTDGHHHFFERGIARPLADSVDGALHLSDAVLNRRQGIGNGQAKVVVAVNAQRDPVDSLDRSPEGLNERSKL